MCKRPLPRTAPGRLRADLKSHACHSLAMSDAPGPSEGPVAKRELGQQPALNKCLRLEASRDPCPGLQCHGGRRGRGELRREPLYTRAEGWALHSLLGSCVPLAPCGPGGFPCTVQARGRQLPGTVPGGALPELQEAAGPGPPSWQPAPLPFLYLLFSAPSTVKG